MNEKLSNLIDRLKENNIEFRLIELSERAISVEDVVKFSKGDIKKKEICKTMIVKTDKGYVGLFLEGDKKINFDKVQKILNSKVRLATLAEVKEITGVDTGAVCPILLGMPLVMDEMVLNLEKVNFGSGDHLYGIEMKPRDILKIREAKISNISD